MIPVWVAGDPLVGILTTIGFFTFIIVGRALRLRQLQHKNKS